MWKTLKKYVDIFIEINPDVVELASDAKYLFNLSVNKSVHSVRKNLQTRLKITIEDVSFERLLHLWSKIRPFPVGQEILRELSTDASSTFVRSLLTAMSRSSISKYHHTLRAFTNNVIYMKNREESNGKNPEQVMSEITLRVCTLNNVGKRSWEYLFRFLVPVYHQSRLSHLMASNSVPRLLLPAAAAVLHGHDLRHEEFLAALLIAYSAGNIATDVSNTMVSFFVRLYSTSPLDIAYRERELNAAADRLMSISGGCQQIGFDSWHFFEALNRNIDIPPKPLSIEKWSIRERFNNVALNSAQYGEIQVYHNVVCGFIFFTFLILFLMYEVRKVVQSKIHDEHKVGKLFK